MKKKIIWRGILGFPIGITVGYIITIIISLIWADGSYMSCRPELISVMGNEMNAVLVQAVFCGLLGTGFAAASFIWEVENWGIAKQTGIYFLVISVLMMPAAYVTYWMEHSWTGFFSYYGIFILIPASNEPSSRACTDIWRLPRGSHTPLLCSVASLMPRCLQRDC